jgi:hypothetical protein
MYVSGKMRHVETVPGMMEGVNPTKIYVRTSVNVTIYP